VSIRAIADAVGVTPPSIYLHFPDKEALILEVCHRQFETLDAALEAAGAAADGPLDELERRGMAYVRFGLEHPEAYRIMFMSRPRDMDHHVDTVEKSGSTAFSHHVEAVDRARRAGAIRADVDPVEGAIFLWSGVHGITSLLIALATFPWGDQDRLVREVCRTQLRALLPD
jgi:AcrR family transcriptional regulator